jgi:hypothetical protein
MKLAWLGSRLRLLQLLLPLIGPLSLDRRALELRDAVPRVPAEVRADVMRATVQEGAALDLIRRESLGRGVVIAAFLREGRTSTQAASSQHGCAQVLHARGARCVTNRVRLDVNEGEEEADASKCHNSAHDLLYDDEDELEDQRANLRQSVDSSNLQSERY